MRTNILTLKPDTIRCLIFLFKQATVKRVVNSGELDFLHDAIYKVFLKISNQKNSTRKFTHM